MKKKIPARAKKYFFPLFVTLKPTFYWEIVVTFWFFIFLCHLLLASESSWTVYANWHEIIWKLPLPGTYDERKVFEHTRLHTTAKKKSLYRIHQQRVWTIFYYLPKNIVLYVRYSRGATCNGLWVFHFLIFFHLEFWNWSRLDSMKKKVITICHPHHSARVWTVKIWILWKACRWVI